MRRNGRPGQRGYGERFCSEGIFGLDGKGTFAFTVDKEEEDLSCFGSGFEKADRRLRAYSGRYGLRMGTTATVLLLFRGMYYIAHVGDSRVYELGKKARQVTSDQTLVAEEVKRGLLTEEQAGNDPRRNILLQCVGGNGCIPEHICGTVKEGAVYLVCSDGFCHEISAEEMKDTFCPEQMQDEETLEERCRILVERNLERGERDNISVIAIRTEKERRNAGNRFGH